MSEPPDSTPTPEEPGGPDGGTTARLAALAGPTLNANDLNEIARALEEDPDAVLPGRPRTRAIVGPVSRDALPDADRDALLEMARQAVAHLRARRPGSPVTAASLTAQEQIGAALLTLLVARPALLVSGRTFVTPQTKPWSVLQDFRSLIEPVLPRVGRIEVAELPQPGYVGTGFVVGRDGLVLTNRHVAGAFALKTGPNTWDFRRGFTVRIDFGEEHRAAPDPGDGAATTFAVEDVLGWHDTYDLALLRIARRSADGQNERPDPLTLATGPDTSLEAGRRVFTVGYPARSASSPEPALMDALFERIYNVKRLQPGAIVQVFTGGEEGGTFLHDCSTLGGNSGSCVADLETGDVIGLHYGGYHGRFNLAVALWMLRNDPFLALFTLNWAS